jgi:hypothetical protein
VTSRADGTLLIEPVYRHPWKGPEEGGGPGLFTRIALAVWCENRLAKRGTRDSASGAQVPD